MVVLDPFNPRSVAFQIKALEEHLVSLPTLNEDGMPEIPQRMVLKLAAEIATVVAATLDTTQILSFEQNLLNLAEAIAARYFLHGPNFARADKMSAIA
jgi:uncharacterized alpha-E superfamily protein